MTKQLGETRFLPTAILTTALIVTCTAAHADVMVVTSTDGTTGGPDCTLRDAITASNADSPVGGCPHSGTAGADTIELAPSELYLLFVVDNSIFGPNGLPFINGDLTINGNGSAIERDPNAEAFRIFFVGGRGILRLNDVTLRNGLAEGFSANGLGGAIFNLGPIELVNTMLVDNIAVRGGAIENADFATLTDCTVSNNTATFLRGGGIYNFDGALTMRNCTVSDNFAPAQGGGIYHDFGLLTLVNTTLSGNMAGDSGGGLYVNARVVMGNCTVSNNSAPVGAGICSCGTSTTFIEIADTIVADQNSGADCAGTFVSGGYNLDTDGSCGFVGPGDISGGAASLGPLQNNGGVTDTHALLASSDAIDAGSCGAGSVAVDQRGVARPIGNGCDIGAYEAECSRDGTCSGHGDCAADESCFCDVGFAGPACEFSDDVTCHGHGAALDDGSCACEEGFAGASCDACAENYFDFPECVFCAADVSCSSQGVCDNTTGDCICDGGWTGAACDTDVDECAQSPCQNGGVCVNEPGSFSCDCASGWSGELCEMDVDECAEEPCDLNATCTNEPGSFQCTCNEGFVGDGFACAAEAEDDGDADGDGVPDDVDDCPDENAAGLDADGDGCIDSFDGVIELIDELSEDEIADQMINSLTRKVEAAARQAQRGNICAAVGSLTALQDQIAAQRGKKISEEAADLLTAYVENLIGQLAAELPEGETCGGVLASGQSQPGRSVELFGVSIDGQSEPSSVGAAPIGCGAMPMAMFVPLSFGLPAMRGRFPRKTS